MFVCALVSVCMCMYAWVHHSLTVWRTVRVFYSLNLKCLKLAVIKMELNLNVLMVGRVSALMTDFEQYYNHWYTSVHLQPVRNGCWNKLLGWVTIVGESWMSVHIVILAHHENDRKRCAWRMFCFPFCVCLVCYWLISFYYLYFSIWTPLRKSNPCAMLCILL